MSLHALISSAASGEAGPWPAMAGIVLLSFVLEDAATIAAATLAAQNILPLPLPLALGALVFGIAAGDLGLYGLGALARRHGALYAWLRARGLARAEGFLTRNLLEVVVISRFIPGLRLPTYAALGLAGAPFLRFALIAVVAVGLWSSLVVLGTVMLGSALTGLLDQGLVRWIVIPVFVAALILLPRLLIRSRGSDIP